METDEDYRRGRHVVSALHVHLVFVTKYRRGVLTGDMTGYLAGVLGKVSEDFGADLREFNGEHDHVHLLVEYPPTFSSLAAARDAIAATVASSPACAQEATRRYAAAIPARSQSDSSPGRALDSQADCHPLAAYHPLASDHLPAGWLPDLIVFDKSSDSH